MIALAGAIVSLPFHLHVTWTDLTQGTGLFLSLGGAIQVSAV